MEQYKGEDSLSISLITQKHRKKKKWDYTLADLYVTSILIRCVKF